MDRCRKGLAWTMETPRSRPWRNPFFLHGVARAPGRTSSWLIVTTAARWRSGWASCAGDYDDLVPSVTHGDSRRINEIRWERRAADNTSAVERWAEALTKDVPKGARVAFMKRLLPDNLIGRHALTHLDFLDRDVDHRRWRAEREQSRRRQVGELTEIVERLIGIGAHAEINIAIKRAHRAGYTRSRYDRSVGTRIEWEEQKDCCAKPVLLAGSHDIDAFVLRVTHTEHTEWADAIKKLSNQLGGQF